MSHASSIASRLAALWLTSLAATLPAFAAQAVVHGNANPNLAGRAPGYACCSGDSAPQQSPVQVTDLPLVAGQVLLFDVSGVVSHTGSAGNGNNPDGQIYGGSPSHFGDGIAAPLNVDRINALVGVFLGDASPTGAATPDRIDYAGALTFNSVVPRIGQIFFIGDGRTSDTLQGDFGGQTQAFHVPQGATRLFLGTSDGFGWYNNNGQFDVTITAVPEPTALCLLLAGAAVVTGRHLLRSR